MTLEARARGIEAARIAAGVDLAAVEFAALLLVAHDIVGGADLLEALLGPCIAAWVSGWCFLASARNAFLISASLAVFATPSTS
jgi:hypothetical protein